jgi:hypothetical protein
VCRELQMLFHIFFFHPFFRGSSAAGFIRAPSSCSMLTYADVCWRMLTYADVCWRMQCAAGFKSAPSSCSTGKSQRLSSFVWASNATAGPQFTYFTGTKVQILTRLSPSCSACTIRSLGTKRQASRTLQFLYFCTGKASTLVLASQARIGAGLTRIGTTWGQFCTFVLVKQVLLYHLLKLEFVQALQELERKKDQTPCPETPQQGFKGERDFTTGA